MRAVLISLFVTGLCGGSASGKTTVARKIIEALDVPWVVLLSMDSFYKVCMFNKVYIIHTYIRYVWYVMMVNPQPAHSSHVAV